MTKGPNQLKPRRIKRADIGVILIIVLLIVGIFIFMRNAADKPEELEINDFIDYVKRDGIENATITPLGGDNIGYVNITGEYRKVDDDTVGRYTIMISESLFDEEIRPYFLANGVKTDFKKMSSVDWFSIIVLVILPILLVVGMIIFFMRSAGGAGGTNRAFEFGRSRARLARHTKTTFKDVAGVDEEKEELEEIIDFLKFPKKYFEIGARIPKGILLVGPPGTGKTLLAKAVAGEAKVPFFSISGSDFVEMFVGVGASRVRDMFKNAKQAAPCIVFI